MLLACVKLILDNINSFKRRPEVLMETVKPIKRKTAERPRSRLTVS